MSAERTPLDLLNRDGLSEAVERAKRDQARVNEDPHKRQGQLIGACENLALGIRDLLVSNADLPEHVTQQLERLADYAERRARGKP